MSSITKTKRFLIHDNGGRPYMVSINPSIKEASIFTFNNDEFSDFSKFPKKKDYTIPITNFKYQKVFVGQSLKNSLTEFGRGYGKSFLGNTILFLIEPILPNQPKNYIFVSHKIYSFKANDEIISFFSPVGNNDVPYPYAIGEKNVYFLNNAVFIKRNVFPIEIKENMNLPSTLFDYLYSGKLPSHKIKGIKKLMS